MTHDHFIREVAEQIRDLAQATLHTVSTVEKLNAEVQQLRQEVAELQKQRIRTPLRIDCDEEPKARD